MRTAEIVRRCMWGGTTETVETWHDGPGSPGGRTYDVIYATSGKIRIDVSGAWSSALHTVWLEAEEIRPREEWLAYLQESGRQPVEPRWCAIDGREIPADRIANEIPGDPELYCSTDCAIESRPKW